MKKILFLSSLLAAALATVSCSSDDKQAEEQAKNLLDGNSYVSFSINLPFEPSYSSRAANDTYKYGTDDEYKVSSVKIFIFDGNENNSVLKEVLTPTAPTSWSQKDVNTDATDVVKKEKFVQQLTASVTNPYALVVLNAPDDLVCTVGSSTYEDVATQTISGLKNGDGNLTMVSAPLANTKGGSTSPKDADINTLVKVKTYASQALATAGTSNEIYVERVAAKVTVLADATDKKYKTSTEETDGIVKGWMLDNMEPASYAVRQVKNTYFDYYNEKAEATNYRFVGGTDIGGGNWRIYWAEDPHYSVESPTLKAYSTATTSEKTDGTTPIYCHENTFALEQQTLANTTRVIVKVEFNDGKDFYVLNGATTTIYDETGIKTALKTAIFNNSTVKGYYGADTWTSAELGVTLSAKDPNTGVVTISGITFPTSATKKSELESAASTIMSAVNGAYKVEKYDGGIAYYPILIKHFGDDLTPWSIDYNHTASTHAYDYKTAGLDKDDEAMYLGRYGVLRNNWYNIRVKSIKKIGSPVVTPVAGKTTTDDLADQYLNYAINVFSWAYRNQEEVLE